MRMLMLSVMSSLAREYLEVYLRAMMIPFQHATLPVPRSIGCFMGNVHDEPRRRKREGTRTGHAPSLQQRLLTPDTWSNQGFQRPCTLIRDREERTHRLLET